VKTPSSARRGVALLACALSNVALAQTASTGIVADRLRPAIGPTTLAAAEGADPTPSGTLSTVLSLGYLRDPIRLHASDGSLVSMPVRGQLNGVFGFEVGLPRGFALRASVPVTIVNDGDRLRGTGVGGSGNDPGPALEAAAGDLSFGIKVGILGAPSLPGLHAALALEGTVPLGGQAQFAATDGPTIAPRVMIDYRLPWISLVLDVQARFAGQRTLFDTNFGDELLLSGGVIGGIARFGANKRWHLIAYVEGQGVVAAGAAARPGELRAALRLTREAAIDLDLGGGAGLVDAVGSPRFRVFALLRVPLVPRRAR
jgi:hypothetical protein